MKNKRKVIMYFIGENDETWLENTERALAGNFECEFILKCYKMNGLPLEKPDIVFCSGELFKKLHVVIKPLVEATPETWFVALSTFNDKEELLKKFGVRHFVSRMNNFHEAIIALVQKYLDSKSLIEDAGFAKLTQ